MAPVGKIFPTLPRPLLFGHRGDSAHAPENTLEAFELAVKLGAHVLELDVHLTRDNEVVVIHDATVDRTTDGHGPVIQKSYAELARLDAGYRFRAAGSHPFRGQECVVPRLEEVLRGFPKAGFNIELKQANPPMARQVLDILGRVGAENVLLTAGDQAIMEQLEACNPGCGLGLSKRQVVRVLRTAYLGGDTDFGGRALQIPLRDAALAFGLLPVATARAIRFAHARGLEVHLYTLDDRATARRWLDRGADGIMSNEPGTLAALF